MINVHVQDIEMNLEKISSTYHYGCFQYNLFRINNLKFEINYKSNTFGRILFL